MEAGKSYERGVALVIVLAFVVLLTVVVVAFFVRATSDRQVSNSSANQARADIMARSALDVIVGDLKQEIAAGSAPAPPGVPLYMPTVPANMVPRRSGIPAPAPSPSPNVTNLVRRSVRFDSITAPGVASRASAVNSTTDVSSNNRSISLSRWNSHYLLPRHDTGTGIDSTPISPLNTTAPGPEAYGFTPPDWVMVTANGPTVLTAPDSTTVGRYAYAIYDESALLDVNVAGYPMRTTVGTAADAPYTTGYPPVFLTPPAGYTPPTGLNAPPAYTAQTIGTKGSLAFADLSALSEFSGSASAVDRVNQFVGWRNLASAQPTVLGSLKYTFDAAAATRYSNFVTGSTSGFLNVSPQASPSPVTAASRTDQVFASRQALLKFRRATGFSQNALQYLGTFSRAINAPSWKPTATTGTPAGNTVDYAGQADTSTSINRNLPNVRFPSTATIKHYYDDGTTTTYAAQVGDSLLQRRFSLAKLAWFTPSGPKAGISAQAIADCFGLQWDLAKWRWDYVAAKSPPGVRIKTLAEVAGENREPNFFELLNAGILSSSLGRDPGLGMDQSVAAGVGVYSSQFNVYKAEPNLHTLQIGANIIDQYDADSYPIAIHFDAWGLTGADDLSLQTVYGIENLPYLLGLSAIGIADPVPPGAGANGTLKSWVQPQLWNPHQAPSSALAQYPAGFRAYAYGKILIAWSLGNGWSPRYSPWTYYDDGFGVLGTPGNPGVIYFTNPADSASPFYTTPRLLTVDLATAPGGSLIVDQAQTPSSNYYNPAKWSNLNGDDLDSATNQPKNKFVGFSLTGDPNYNPEPSNGLVGRKMLLPDITTRAYFSLQYKGADGNYHPYNFMGRLTQDQRQDFKHLKPSRETNASPPAPAAPYNPTTTVGGETASRGYGGGRLDPRTDRFSESTQNWLTTGTTNTMNPKPTDYYPPGGSGAGTAYSIPYIANVFLYGDTVSPNTYDPMNPTTGHVELFLRNDSTYSIPSRSDIASGDIGKKAFYKDPDGVVRLADGYREYMPLSGTASGDGNELYNGDAVVSPASTLTTPGTGSARSRRPVILNRPFRSVGELGFAHRDLPYKSLDFWSSTSADAALIDLFSVTDQPTIVAGQINPTNASASVLKAVLSGVAKSDALGVLLSSSDLATLTNTITTDITTTGPYSNRADLATRLGPLISGSSGTVAFNTTVPANANWANKAYAEAPMRALADVTNTRTWNLLIDVVAQAGNFSPGATDLGKNFVVQGERRYWLHVAIDRFTGKIVDQQLEPVYE